MWRRLASAALFLIFAGVSAPAYSASLEVTQERITHPDESVTVIVSVRDTETNKEIVGEWFHCEDTKSCVKFLTTGEHVFAHTTDDDEEKVLPKAVVEENPLRLLESTAFGETPQNVQDGGVSESAETLETIRVEDQTSVPVTLNGEAVEVAYAAKDEPEPILEAVSPAAALDHPDENIGEAARAVVLLEPSVVEHSDGFLRDSEIAIAVAEEELVADHGPSLPPQKQIEEPALPNIKREMPMPTHERNLIPTPQNFESPRAIAVAFTPAAPDYPREVREAEPSQEISSGNADSSQVLRRDSDATRTQTTRAERVQFVFLAFASVFVLLLMVFAHRAKRRINRAEENIARIQKDILTLIDRL